MAKKKQLAGKKTKLAKLPLTQVLARQTEETAPWGRSLSAAEPGPRQFSPSQEEAGRGTDGPLATAYFQVIQDLLALQSEMPVPGGVAWRQPGSGSRALPSPARLKEVLLQAREDLRDLQHFLSLG
jgi:hypothetical protein